MFQRNCRALDRVVRAFDEAFDERAFDDEAFEEAFSSDLKNTISRRFNCSFTASDLNE